MFLHRQNCEHGGECMFQHLDSAAWEEHCGYCEHVETCPRSSECINTDPEHLRRYAHPDICVHGAKCKSIATGAKCLGRVAQSRGLKGKPHFQGKFSKLRHHQDKCRDWACCPSFGSQAHMDEFQHPFLGKICKHTGMSLTPDIGTDSKIDALKAGCAKGVSAAAPRQPHVQLPPRSLHGQPSAWQPRARPCRVLACTERWR